jgi:hypothetical protein
MEDLDRLLRSVGMKAFVEYYDIFKRYKNSDDNSQVINSMTENWTYNGKSTRASCAKRIFRAGLEKEALLMIIGASRVEPFVQKKAEEILQAER